MSPRGTNKMGFIDSARATFTHHDTIAGGMHLQKQFGETKRRRARVPDSKLQHVGRASERPERHILSRV